MIKLERNIFCSVAYAKTGNYYRVRVFDKIGDEKYSIFFRGKSIESYVKKGAPLRGRKELGEDLIFAMNFLYFAEAIATMPDHSLGVKLAEVKLKKPQIWGVTVDEDDDD